MNSTLIRGSLAYPGQIVVFICVVKNFTILEWRSDDYIKSDSIPIYSSGPTDFVSSEAANATRVNVTVEGGITVIVSQLFIVAKEEFPMSSVTCSADGNGPRQTIFFNTTSMFENSLQAFQYVRACWAKCLHAYIPKCGAIKGPGIS